MPGKAKTKNVQRNWVYDSARYLGLVIIATSPFPLAGNRAWFWEPAGMLLVVCMYICITLGPGASTDACSGIKPTSWHGKRPLIEPGIWALVIGFSWAVLWTADMGLVAGYWPSARGSSAAPLTIMLSISICYVLGNQYFSKGRHAETAFKVLTVSALVQVIIAVANDYLTGGLRLLWYTRPSLERELHGLGGTFIYKNALGIYLTLISSICLVQVLSITKSHGWLHANSVKTFVVESSKSGSFVFWFSSLVLLSSTALGTLSRFVALTVIGCLSVVIVSYLHLSRAHIRFRYILIAVSAAILPLSLISESLLSRMYRLPMALAEREALYRQAMEMIAQKPLAGWGPGSYKVIQQNFPGIENLGYIQNLHSTLLQSIVEFGLPLTLVLLASPLLILSRLARASARRRGSARMSALGFGIIFVLALQGAFDFTLEMPAVAFHAAFLLGIAAGANGLASVNKT